MGATTKIEWTQGEDGSAGATWTPIRAKFMEPQKDGTTKERIGWHCAHASPGCLRCYAAGINRRLGTGLDFIAQNGEKVDVFLDNKMLRAPLSWRAPRKIFVCSMTDIGADFVSDLMIDRIVAVAAACHQHEFIFLTKRVDRLARHLASASLESLATSIPSPSNLQMSMHEMTARLTGVAGDLYSCRRPVWPLRNVTIGASVEDQRRADERREPLAAIAAAGWRTWVSYEPALGPVEWCGWEFVEQIVGGSESGQRSRGYDHDWFRATRDFCAGAGIAYFQKQLTNDAGRKLPTEQWPQDLIVRQYPSSASAEGSAS